MTNTITIKFDTQFNAFTPFVDGVRMTVIGDRENVQEAVKDSRLHNAMLDKAEAESNNGLLFHMAGFDGEMQEAIKEEFEDRFSVFIV